MFNLFFLQFTFDLNSVQNMRSSVNNKVMIFKTMSSSDTSQYQTN